MKIRFTLGALFFFTSHTFAQISDSAKQWRLSSEGGLTATQAAYSDNWAGDESGSLAYTFTSKSEASKQLTRRLNSLSTLKLSFGQTYSQRFDATGNSFWERPRKSTDLIDLESVLRFTFGGYVDPYLAGRVETQFTDASNAVVRRYLNPLKITESGGILRVFVDKPKVLEFRSRLGFAIRQIITNDVIGLQPVATERTITDDGGLESVTDFLTSLGSSLTYSTKLTLYKALFFSESDAAVNDDWKAADVNWEHIISATVTKFIQTNLYLQLLYDKQIDNGTRIKETMGLGISLKWDNIKKQ
ncbi:MAG: hypothetical protein SGI97_05920 [candidate division Zixibacteria bacterium]|nr:hypothetical protein [candidate division Zixibacteria bacterium]